MPNPDASVSMIKGLLMSGRAKTEGLIIAFFKVSKAKVAF